MKTERQITSKISHIEYVCPHCNQKTSYDTDSIPTKNTCHQCLKTIDFQDIVEMFPISNAIIKNINFNN